MYEHWDMLCQSDGYVELGANLSVCEGFWKLPLTLYSLCVIVQSSHLLSRSRLKSSLIP